MRFLGFIFLFIACVSAWARPDLPKPYVTVPIVIDGQTRDQIWIFPRAQRKNFALEADPLFKILTPFLRSDIARKLEQKKTSQGTVSLRDLDGIGLKAEFSEQALEIQIDIPLKLRKTNELDLTYHENGDLYHKRPDRQSGYLNLRMAQPYQYGDSAASDTKQPFTGRADFFENIGGFVFETGTEYTEQSLNPFRRQDTRVVWDSEESMVRFIAGEFDSSPRGFQAASSVAGVSISREFSIQPYRTARPLGNSELIIKRPSIVEIYINGTMYTQIRLNPGRFNVKDFPIVNGQNDVRVKIKDDLGQEETFNFSALYENTILLQGTSEFGYFAGKPWTESGGDRAYDQKNIVSSFYHRYGFTDQVTGGFNYQNFQGQSLAGLELSVISSLGFFTFDGGCSKSSFEQKGCAERLRYRSLDRIMGYESKTVLGLEAERREIGFSPVITTPLAPNGYESRLDAQLTRQLADFFFVGVGGTYEKGGTLIADTRIYRANVVLPLTTRFRLEGTYSETVDVARNNNFLISLFWIDAPGVHSASSYYDSNNSSSNLTLSRNNIKRYDDYRLNASVGNSGGIQSSDISADYFMQPAALRLENFASRSSQRNYNVATAGLNTGFAWVGSSFTTTQPIQDSFALIEAENLPPNQVLMINPNGDYSEAQLGPRKTVALNQYTAYYKYTVNLDSTSLPMGYLMDKEFYNVMPTYRSGILIPVHLTSKVMVKGHLYSVDRQPMGLVVGDIFDSRDRLVENNFFTNKNGVFVIEGLEPGDYYIKTDNRKTGKIPLHIQPNDNNFLTVDLTAPPSEEGESL